VTDPNTPLDSALDLLVFVPVGIAVTAAEELPKLAAKGRARVEQQVAVARVVGQFAVAKGRGELRKRVSGDRAKTGAGTTEGYAADTGEEEVVTTAVAGAADTAEAAGSEVSGPDTEFPTLTGSGEAERTVDGVQVEPGGAVPADVEAPPSESLAIPGYDSLSASQVVQRLAGLSDQELAAVGAYETAHRARQTVLARVSQLQLGRD
jgi:hypothetical protein